MLVFVQDPPSRSRLWMGRGAVWSRSVNGAGQWAQRPAVGDALVWSMLVVELFELAQRMKEVALVPDQCPGEQLSAAGLYPPFGDRVYASHLHAGKDDCDACGGEDGVEQRREFAVSVVEVLGSGCRASEFLAQGFVGPDPRS